MGGESHYQVKILSKQLNKPQFRTVTYFSTFIEKSLTSTAASIWPEQSLKEPLNPWFITGFSDAESCFSISIQPSAKMKINWRVLPVYLIKLHIKDILILEKIKNTLGVGTIRKNGINMVTYTVESFKDLQVIINHFEKYPLLSAKLSDYLLFKECFEIIKEKKHLTEEGLLKLVGLKSSLNWGLSDNLKKAFPNVVLVNRPEYVFKGITDPFWVSGFTSGDGSFHIKAYNYEDMLHSDIRNRKSVELRFSINLNIREKDLIKGLAIFFKSYNTKVSNSEYANISVKQRAINIFILEKSVGLQITKISDINNIIIPFFEKYPIEGIKSLDFYDFKKAALIVKNKEHLISEGFNNILKLKLSMNKNRSW